MNRKILLEEYKNTPILIAIGMKSMRSTVRGMFRQIGSSEIVEAETGESVLRHLNDSNREKDFFVILDWDIQGMPGVDVVREIRGDKKLENTPLLLLAEDAVEADVALLGELGVNGCVVKPFVFGALQKKFDEILYKRANPPKHIQIIKVGEEMMNGGRTEEAIQLFLKSQEIKNSARINILIGESHENMGDYYEALELYKTAIEINPLYIKGYKFLANLYLKLDDKENALTYLAKASKISPNNSERQALLGELYLSKGDITKAEETLSVIAAAYPEKGKEIGEKFLAAGHSQEAENFFRKAINAQRTSIETYNRLGIALRKQGKWQEAVDTYKKAIQINHRDEGLYFNMGRSYVEGGLVYEAKECFHRALKLNPELEDAREELAKLANR